MENKWQVQECGEESYAITDGKISIVTSDADNESHLQAIADVLNSSGYRFHSENKLELDLHLEAEVAKMELIDVKAKCERYEGALKWYADEGNYLGDNGELATAWKNKMSLKANEALSAGEGEKIKGIEYMPVHPEDVRKPGCPHQVPMHLLNEDQAQSNHGQTLKRLKERGGLSVTEMLAIIQGRKWEFIKCDDALKMLKDILNQKEDK